MEQGFERRDYGYTIISRFEECLREFCKNKLTNFTSNFLKEIPAGIISVSQERCTELDNNDIDIFMENIDFIHIKEIIGYNKNYEYYFNSNMMDIKEFDDLMQNLYDLRCKIAHIRGYFTSIDLQNLIEDSTQIAKNISEIGEEFIRFINTLKSNPVNLIRKLPHEFISEEDFNERIPNNLPIPDYEYEGGFVGRKDDKQKLIKMIEEDQHKVITIAGAGGVGKSALALNIVKEILRRSHQKFDGVIWLSAKENKLSFLGIEDIEPTIKNYEELLDTILDVMGFKSNIVEDINRKEENVNTLFDLFDKILIVIDNLETITDERVINFILDSHPKTRILITSRKGLGQVERRHDLKQLKEKEAICLFRQIARDKNLENLSKLDDITLKKYVNKVSCYPLAIKWVIGQAALGKDINQVIETIKENTSDISLFCFEQIYRELSETAKQILCALSLFEYPLSIGVLKYVVNISGYDFEDSIRDLVLVSLVIPEQLKNQNNEINVLYSLLPLTRGYVRYQLDKNSALKRNLEERMRTVEVTIEEANRAKKQYRFSLSNLGATSEEEKVAAMLAQTGYQKYQAGAYLEAVEDFKRAITIAPRFPSIYRNLAVVESMEGHFVEADKLMKKAADLNKNDTQIWLTWGNIKRKTDKVKEAYEYYRKAYDLSPEDNVVLNSLGQALCRLGEHEQADYYFKLALNKEVEFSSKKHEIINRSSIVENLKRWSETLNKDRNSILAEEKLLEALKNIQIVVKIDETDVKSCDLYRDILIDLGFFYKYKNDPNKSIEYFSKAVLKNPKRYKEAEKTFIASIEIMKILIYNNRIDEARKILNKDLIRLRRTLRDKRVLTEEFDKYYNMLQDDELRTEGKIIRYEPDRKFCIIEAINSPGQTFLGHINQFVTYINIQTDDLMSKQVSFIAEKNSDDKIAKSIILCQNEEI